MTGAERADYATGRREAQQDRAEGKQFIVVKPGGWTDARWRGYRDVFEGR